MVADQAALAIVGVEAGDAGLAQTEWRSGGERQVGVADASRWVDRVENRPSGVDGVVAKAREESHESPYSGSSQKGSEPVLSW
jgi:hypothetical protein